MSHCSHCGYYEPHDSRGWCRRCICAHVGNRERFEKLRKPGFFARVYIVCVATIAFVDWLRRSPT